MCGISGAYWNDCHQEINHLLFENAVKSMAHRGPDHCGIWEGTGIKFGHNRLSIIDTSAAANQPFFSEDKKYVIVFNGEIFNYRTLAHNLRSQGITLRTQSDTEVLLHLLMQQGVKALDQVLGFFAFAFYDVQKHELLLARDRFGEKPLFYTYQADKKQFFFGSELRSVIPFIDERQTDFDALQLLLQLTYIPAPLTIYRGVQKLEPGTCLKVNTQGIQQEKYYRLPSPVIFNGDEKTALEGLHTHMLQAVESRMVADVPVAGFLSGGIDSTIISGLAHQLNPAYETFSLGFHEAGIFDETADAQIAAKHFGITHHDVKLSENDLLENVETLLAFADEPFGDSSAIALYSLCKTIKGKYKVVLSGDGADEVFGGYNKHYALYLASQKNTYTTLVKYGGALHHLLPKSRHSRWGNKARQLEKMHTVFKKNAFARYWYLATFDQGWAPKLLLKGSAEACKTRLRENFKENDFNAFLRLDLELVLPGDMLYKVDMASMRNAVEIRSPFMDHRLIEYVFSLPGDWKVKNGEKKYLLKKAFSHLLPQSLLQKPKHGFEVPLAQWLNGPLNYLVEKYLSKDIIQEQGIFSPENMALLLRKLRSSNPGDTAALVWTLIQFQKTWLDSYSIKPMHA